MSDFDISRYKTVTHGKHHSIRYLALLMAQVTRNIMWLEQFQKTNKEKGAGKHFCLKKRPTRHFLCHSETIIP